MTNKNRYDGTKGNGYQPLPPIPPNEDSDIPYTERELIQRAINNARPSGFYITTPRWQVVKNLFGVGHSISRLICFKYGFDPDKDVRK